MVEQRGGRQIIRGAGSIIVPNAQNTELVVEAVRPTLPVTTAFGTEIGHIVKGRKQKLVNSRSVVQNNSLWYI